MCCINHLSKVLIELAVLYVPLRVLNKYFYCVCCLFKGEMKQSIKFTWFTRWISIIINNYIKTRQM